jgi:hypothetical protein
MKQFIIFKQSPMNDLSKGKGTLLPEQQPNDVSDARREPVILSILHWIWRRLFPKRAASHMFKLRRRRTRADGSSVETEITYRKDY